MKIFRLKKGSLAIEYALLIAIIILALVSMSSYFQRSLRGKWRQAGDTFGYGRQHNK